MKAKTHPASFFALIKDKITEFPTDLNIRINLNHSNNLL